MVMDQRLRVGKAVALCDWRRQLKAWRAWRTVVWAECERREVARTEEALRIENRRESACPVTSSLTYQRINLGSYSSRQMQLAVESDRRRLLRRCLNEWQLWCQVEKAQRELLARQKETKLKMAALLTAASTGKLLRTPAAPPEPPNQSVVTARLQNSCIIFNKNSYINQIFIKRHSH